MNEQADTARRDRAAEKSLVVFTGHDGDGEQDSDEIPGGALDRQCCARDFMLRDRNYHLPRQCLLQAEVSLYVVEM